MWGKLHHDSFLLCDFLYVREITYWQFFCYVKCPGLVGNVLSYLWLSRRGLTEDELLGILGIPHAIWSPVYLALEESLISKYVWLTSFSCTLFERVFVLFFFYYSWLFFWFVVVVVVLLFFFSFQDLDTIHSSTITCVQLSRICTLGRMEATMRSGV